VLLVEPRDACVTVCKGIIVCVCNNRLISCFSCPRHNGVCRLTNARLEAYFAQAGVLSMVGYSVYVAIHVEVYMCMTMLG
jgi:hypothetical protein